ncbi:hypothetical protein BH11CYA1_BH11CYA1_37360 [soil metagenome]
MRSTFLPFTALLIMSVSVPYAGAEEASTQLQKGGLTTQAKPWQAEEWVIKRTSPWLLPGEAVKQKKEHKGPVRSFAKAVVKGSASELKASMKGLSEDMVFVFSCQDIDPYKKGPSVDKPCIVLKFNMVDGSACYLRRFPDGSYAIEDGFADGTVILPEASTGAYLIKYPNGVKGKLVRKANGSTVVYRPDKTITTIAKTNSGGYTVRNDKMGYMGEARPDRTGVHYELGEW